MGALVEQLKSGVRKASGAAGLQHRIQALAEQNERQRLQLVAMRDRAKAQTERQGELRQQARAVDDRLNRQAARLRELEAEVQEGRELNRRLAELIDIVGELLIPMAQRDEAGVAEAIERYRARV